nr:MAG TPA: hypothetical protein [Caudoviricetes sp.]
MEVVSTLNLKIFNCGSGSGNVYVVLLYYNILLLVVIFIVKSKSIFTSYVLV